MRFPQVVLVKQHSDIPAITNVADVVRQEVARLNLQVKRGARIAIAVGSRGIDNHALIVRTLAEELKAWGAEPFIVPAMGSHGGASAEGQVMVLETLGITEKSTGVPIRSSMEVVQLGTTASGIPVFIDKTAAQADGIVLVHRVKAHTDFGGPIESGMMKLITIGLGKHKGAQIAHRFAVQRGFNQVIPVVARYVLKKIPVLFGMGLVENFYHETAVISAAKPENLEETEKELLRKAKTMMARIPFGRLDLVVVPEIGKTISGTGMDTNVVGRIYNVAEPEAEFPQYTRIVALDLADDTYGNAVGIGMADLATRRLVDKIDFKATAINCLTGACPEKGRIPITLDSAREVIAAALMICGPVEPEGVKMVWIKNTLELDQFYISRVLIPASVANPNLEILSDLMELPFDAEGNLAWITPCRTEHINLRNQAGI
ncbi:lactate racemase domain-containing protein [Sporomusa aerivorans]|uniref:lactate racemase domain-containing protein n=1 Tax=Sporomusa aerivorans TaxID=204936 RepID=UPI003529E735